MTGRFFNVSIDAEASGEPILFPVTHHARERMQQRGISKRDLELALTFGQVKYLAGAKVVFVGQRDIPASRRRELAHLEGIVIVLAVESNAVMTSYRNKTGLRDLKRLRKRKNRSRAACA